MRLSIDCRPTKSLTESVVVVGQTSGDADTRPELAHRGGQSGCVSATMKSRGIVEVALTRRSRCYRWRISDDRELEHEA